MYCCEDERNGVDCARHIACQFVQIFLGDKYGKPAGWVSSSEHMNHDVVGNWVHEPYNLQMKWKTLLSFSGNLASWENYVLKHASPSVNHTTSMPARNLMEMIPSDSGKLREHTHGWLITQIKDIIFCIFGIFSICSFGVVLWSKVQKSVLGMPQGQQTCPKIQWEVVWLSRHLDHERIAICLDMSLRTTKRILAHFHTYGTIPNPCEDAAPKEKTGNTHLWDVEIEVTCRTISWFFSETNQ